MKNQHSGELIGITSFYFVDSFIRFKGIIIVYCLLKKLTGYFWFNMK